MTASSCLTNQCRFLAGRLLAGNGFDGQSWPSMNSQDSGRLAPSRPKSSTWPARGLPWPTFSWTLAKSIFRWALGRLLGGWRLALRSFPLKGLFEKRVSLKPFKTSEKRRKKNSKNQSRNFQKNLSNGDPSQFLKHLSRTFQQPLMVGRSKKTPFQGNTL